MRTARVLIALATLLSILATTRVARSVSAKLAGGLQQPVNFIGSEILALAARSAGLAKSGEGRARVDQRTPL